MAVKQILLKGTPFERGFHYGRVCREEIRVSIESYKRLFKRENGFSWEESLNIACRFLPFIKGKYDVYIEEMKGIAEGAGVGFKEVLALNCRTEIMYTGVKSGETPNECSAFSAVPPASAEGTVLAGQTWDFTVAQRDAMVILRLPREGDAPARLIFTEGGMIGGMGVNTAGLSLTLNALETEGAGEGVPLRVRMRAVLDQSTVKNAYAAASEMPIPFASNLIITSKDGVSISLELDPSGCDVLLPEDGIIVHTNHFIGPRMVLNHQHADSASTYLRMQTLKQNLRSKKGLTAADIEGFFRDHRGYPTSVCNHPSPGLSEEERRDAYITDLAFVAELKSGTVRFVEGNPCEGEFAEIKIEE